MRASILLVLAVALAVGLGVAVFVKNIGLLFPQTAVVQAPPPPPEIRVLAAARTLFPGDVILPGDVGTRPASAAEIAAMKDNVSNYFPPSADAAHFRYIAKVIEANSPITRDLVEAPKKPEALNTRLPAGTKAVGVAVPKDRSAGGLIQLGDWVDVYLTTLVGRTDSKGVTPRTALIAKNANVVVKRNSLFPIYAPLPEGQDVHFTLAVNPYRAAMIEHGMTVGQLSLVPANEVEKKRLDTVKSQIESDGERAVLLTNGDAESQEYRDELKKVRDYTSGKLSVGPEQLMAALNLRPLNPPVRPLPPIAVEVLNGSKSKTALFARATDDAGEAPAPEYIFSVPEAKEPKKPEPKKQDGQSGAPKVRTLPGGAPAKPAAPTTPQLPAPQQLRQPGGAPSHGGGGGGGN